MPENLLIKNKSMINITLPDSVLLKIISFSLSRGLGLIIALSLILVINSIDKTINAGNEKNNRVRGYCYSLSHNRVSDSEQTHVRDMDSFDMDHWVQDGVLFI